MFLLIAVIRSSLRSNPYWIVFVLLTFVILSYDLTRIMIQFPTLGDEPDNIPVKRFISFLKKPPDMHRRLQRHFSLPIMHKVDPSASLLPTSLQNDKRCPISEGNSHLVSPENSPHDINHQPQGNHQHLSRSPATSLIITTTALRIININDSNNDGGKGDRENVITIDRTPSFGNDGTPLLAPVNSIDSIVTEHEMLPLKPDVIGNSRLAHRRVSTSRRLTSGVSDNSKTETEIESKRTNNGSG